MSTKLQSGISEAFWCTHEGTFEDAKIPSMRTSQDESMSISWFDKLFEGGIYLPDLPKDKKRAITFLITGPPGSGKSTLAMELCYRWTQNRQIKQEGLRSLYITSEATTEWIREKAISFGWNGADRAFEDVREEPLRTPMVHVWETIDFKEYLEYEKELSPLLAGVLNAMCSFMKIDSKGADQIATQIIEKQIETQIRKKIGIQDPDILVIDSLNTIESTERPGLFKRFTNLSSCGPRIILVVLDSDSSQSNFEFWEYICDIVVRLDHKDISGYIVRTIEIIKARYQSHVWGVHQLKIYPSFKEPEGNTPEKIKKLRQSHPYRNEGGIFIFPSIHYYLSVYKRLAPTTHPIPDATHIDTLNKMLEGGLPKGRCTALIGCRGGHKSHLGYLHLLSRVIQNKQEKALVISLRDDEGMADTTMEGILRQEFPKETRELRDFRDRLEILYYPPGYITPEEFFHRMFMSIHRLKKNGVSELTVLFNSLDQLSARFPLCTKEDIFIPGIIDTLLAENITSIFIAVDEPGQPPEQYGLLTMADLILSFSRGRFTAEHYCGHLEEGNKTDKNAKEIENILGKYPQAVELRVVRFAGGHVAGAEGVLELVEEGKPSYKVYKQKVGLHFTPFSPKYSQGEIMEGYSYKTDKTNEVISNG